MSRGALGELLGAMLVGLVASCTPDGASGLDDDAGSGGSVTPSTPASGADDDSGGAGDPAPSDGSADGSADDPADAPPPDPPRDEDICEGAPYDSDRSEWGGDGRLHPASACDAPRPADVVLDLSVVHGTKNDGTEKTQSFSLYVPPDLCFVRCAVVQVGGFLSRGLMDPENKNAIHAHRFAQEHGCAVVEGPQCGIAGVDGADDQLHSLDLAMEEFAELTDRPELAHVPWAFTGFSCSADTIGQMANARPERTIAGVGANCGVKMKEALRVPAMAVVSGDDTVCKPANILEKARDTLARSPQFGIAVVPGIPHGNVIGANHITYSFFDAAFERRLPEQWDGRSIPTLSEIPFESGRWGHHDTLETAPAGGPWDHPLEETSWLINDRVARRWQEIWCGLQ